MSQRRIPDDARMRHLSSAPAQYVLPWHVCHRKGTDRADMCRADTGTRAPPTFKQAGKARLQKSRWPSCNSPCVAGCSGLDVRNASGLPAARRAQVGGSL
eukprot:CAMPEP_0198494948 /NCGR_PEP_ID=MMETSP1462-20131121/4908_1 /TAXON_ID=1333877 /ORGANISM="Brandtodinium nutriculum, Strain RCC3387" /LENGTH=99 /DNA_ID=CAMNT_0044223701 /DNA_START=199 /DNA_END=498 /DNA_ORIENTATION=-